MHKFLLLLRIVNFGLFLIFLSFIYMLLVTNSKIDEINYQIKEVDYLISEQYLEIKNLNTVMHLLSSHKNILSFLKNQNNYGYLKASFQNNSDNELVEDNPRGKENSDIFSITDKKDNKTINVTKNKIVAKRPKTKTIWNHRKWKGIKNTKN